MVVHVASASLQEMEKLLKLRSNYRVEIFEIKS